MTLKLRALRWSFFNGKSGAEILDELVKILKMYNSSLKMAKETQRLLHDLTRKDEKLS